MIATNQRGGHIKLGGQKQIDIGGRAGNSLQHSINLDTGRQKEKGKTENNMEKDCGKGKRRGGVEELG